MTINAFLKQIHIRGCDQTDIITGAPSLVLGPGAGHWSLDTSGGHLAPVAWSLSARMGGGSGLCQHCALTSLRLITRLNVF